MGEQILASRQRHLIPSSRPPWSTFVVVYGVSFQKLRDAQGRYCQVPERHCMTSASGSGRNPIIVRTWCSFEHDLAHVRAATRFHGDVVITKRESRLLSKRHSDLSSKILLPLSPEAIFLQALPRRWSHKATRSHRSLCHGVLIKSALGRPCRISLLDVAKWSGQLFLSQPQILAIG